MTTDLPLRWTMANGFRNVGNAIARRLICAPGTIRHAPNEGYDVRRLFNSSVTPSALSVAQAEIARQCERDDRVLAATAVIKFTQSTQTATIDITLETSDGPFRLTLAASAVTVEVLRAI